MTEHERTRWEHATDEQLIYEYRTTMRDCFGTFAGNARRYSNELVDILLAHGITSIPNIFGAIKVQHWTF